MLDINLLRNDLPAVAAGLAKRGVTLDAARFDSLERERKDVQARTQDLQAKRNALSKAIGAAKGKGEDASALLAEVVKPCPTRIANCSTTCRWSRNSICISRSAAWSISNSYRCRSVSGGERKWPLITPQMASKRLAHSCGGDGPGRPDADVGVVRAEACR